MASAVAQAYNGGLGAQPLIRGLGGEAPLKLEHLVLEHSMEVANLPTFLNF